MSGGGSLMWPAPRRPHRSGEYWIIPNNYFLIHAPCGVTIITISGGVDIAGKELRNG